MDKIKIAILKTLCYADIFDFPLKKEDIYQFLIVNQKVGLSVFNKVLRRMDNGERKMETDGFYYFLKRRGKIVGLRQDRERWSRRKLKIAKRVANFLKIIPTVQIVGVTGALATGNAKKEDDVDLLIVCKKRRIWTTRFLATILVETIAKRRRPREKNIANKICLNMFLDEEHLAVPENERDLFTAHEVVQLKPLWDKDYTYQKFLWENQWVKEFLPNTAKEIKRINEKDIKKRESPNYLITQLLNFFENVLKHFQLWYMRRRRTTEVISDSIIRFHPKDARVWVLKEFRKRLKTYVCF